MHVIFSLFSFIFIAYFFMDGVVGACVMLQYESESYKIVGLN